MTGPRASQAPQESVRGIKPRRRNYQHCRQRVDTPAQSGIDYRTGSPVVRTFARKAKVTPQPKSATFVKSTQVLFRKDPEAQHIRRSRPMGNQALLRSLEANKSQANRDAFESGRRPSPSCQGRPVDLDPANPQAECGQSPVGLQPPEAEPLDKKPEEKKEKKEKHCCGCIDGLKIQNVKKISNGRLYGHSFDTVFSLSYVETDGAANDLTLEWKEKTNRGYTAAMRAANNVWYDMTKDPETAGSFTAWNSRTKPCPGKETSTDNDPPQASLDLPARTLEFEIKVTSGAGCKCANASLTLTAKQVLEPTADPTPAIKTQEFTHS